MLLLFLCVCLVADEGSRPSEDRTGANGAAAQEAEPITAERRSELEHYLKLKRFAVVLRS